MKLRGKWIKSISIARSSSQFPVWSQLPEYNKASAICFDDLNRESPTSQMIVWSFFYLAMKIATPRNEVLFWRLFIFSLLVRSKGRLVSRMHVFSMYFRYYFVKCLSWWIWDDIYLYWRNWLREHTRMSLYGNCGNVPNHHQLGPYNPGTFAGSAHQVNDVP